MAREIPRIAPCPIPRNKWFPVQVYTKLALLRPVAYNLEAVYVAEEDPTSDDLSMGQYRPAKNGVVILFGEESRAVERYVYIDDAQGPATPMRFMKAELGDNSEILAHYLAAGGTLPIGGTGGTADVRNADADADFGAALLGLLANTRLSIWNVTSADWLRLYGGSPAGETGRAHNAIIGAHVIANLFGRDTSDNTIRAIEARATSSASLAAALYRACVDAVGRAYDIGGASFAVLCSDLANVISGRANNSPYAQYVAAITTREDQTNSVLRTVETDRSATSALVNPGALAVGASLDSRCMTNKSVYASASYAGESARLQVSRDNSNWRTVETQACASGAVAAWTALAYEFIRGFRYCRVLAVVGGTGTFTSEISAQGS